MTPLTSAGMEALTAAVVKVALEEWKLLCAAAPYMTDDQVDTQCRDMAAAMKTGKDSIRRKVDAIRYQRTLGFSEEETVAKGQERVVGEWIKSRRQEKYSEMVWIKWQIPGDLRERVVMAVERIQLVLHMENPTQFFEWLLGQIGPELTEEEILHSAGEADPDAV